MKDDIEYCDGLYVEDDYTLCYKRQSCARWIFSKQYLIKRKSHVCTDQNTSYSHYIDKDELQLLKEE